MDTQVLEMKRQGPTPNMQESNGATADGLDHAAEVFVAVRPHLFKIAYRILGNLHEAEDVVQDAWLRWQCTDRTVVLDPPAFLATATTRLAINVTQSARRRHEAYVSRQLAEQVDSNVGPAMDLEQREEVAAAILLLMEKLSATERAAYVLREGFAYPYRQIAEVLQLGVANTRQLVRRAHQRIATQRRAPVDAAEHRHLVQAFLAAATAGNLADLEELLLKDAA